MPKPYTLPTLYNDVMQLSITKLKSWDYLEPNKVQTGTITWSINGNKRGSISVRVNTTTDLSYIVLDYQHGSEPRNYKVRLVSVPSNIGNGRIWYFSCPETGKRCRKLYLVGGYFLHREAFNGCMYESQTWSKKFRSIERQYRDYFEFENTLSELGKKHFKKTYAGKPTKRYVRLQNQLDAAQRYSSLDIQSLYLL